MVAPRAFRLRMPSSPLSMNERGQVNRWRREFTHGLERRVGSSTLADRILQGRTVSKDLLASRAIEVPNQLLSLGLVLVPVVMVNHAALIAWRSSAKARATASSRSRSTRSCCRPITSPPEIRAGGALGYASAATDEEEPDSSGR
jgi:hypothetical protein